MKTTRALCAAAVSVFALGLSFMAPAAIKDPPDEYPDPVYVEFSVYGDSLVYRSNWNCGGGMTTTECDDLRADSSFASYPPFFRPWKPVEYNLHTFDGIGGSTCLPRTGDVGLLARLHDDNEAYVAVLIGINDVNLGGRSVADTVACLQSAWAKIADQLGATPIAITYPPFSRSIWTQWGTTDAMALQNRSALNSAIVQAVTTFNATRTVRRAKLVRLDTLSSYDPAVGVDTFDGVHPNPDGAALMGHSFYAIFPTF